MEKLATENLFLLEFLVDDINLNEKCDCDTPPGDLCVSFQFLDNDPLDVCEADFTHGDQFGKDGNTKNGKSCLYSLTPEQVLKCGEEFDICVAVFKKMQPGWLPEKINVGNALISIANLFSELINHVETQTEHTPSAKTLKDTFDLLDSTGNNVGKIAIYIRMSCFGKLIVTQFQMNLDDKSVLFKDKGGESLYRYKKALKSGMDIGGMMSVPALHPSLMDQTQMQSPQPFNQSGFPPPNYNCPAQPCYPSPDFDCPNQSCYQDQGMYPDMQDAGMGAGPESSMFQPMRGQSMIPCNECSMMFSSQQPSYPPCYNADTMLTPCEECGTLLAPKFEPADESTFPPDGPGNYQEIGASMGGNALTIRVHKDKNKIEQVDGSEVSVTGSCSCSPGNLGVKRSKRDKEGSPQTTAHTNYSMSPGVQHGDKNLPFSIKMGGSGYPPNNNVTINPPVCTKADGTKYTEISDPNKELFVLRIGKKSEGVQKKANLELELCTPRGPDLKPIPKKETRDSQYDPLDCADGGKKGGKKGKGKGKGAKGAKGKGKKGKKGKKK